MAFDGFVGTLIFGCEMSIIRPMRITTDFGRGWRNTLEAGEVGLLRLGVQGPYVDLFWNWL